MKRAKKVVEPPDLTDLTEEEHVQIVARVYKEALKAITHTGHNDRNMPFVDIHEPVTRHRGEQLLGEYGRVISDRARLHRRILSPNEIVKLLGLPKVIHPVKFSGRVPLLTGGPSTIDAYAGWVQCIVRCEARIMTFRFQTRLLGTGPDRESELENYAEWDS